LILRQASSGSRGPSRLELVDEQVVDLEQVGDVGCGVVELGPAERAFEPVGEPVALGEGDAELPFVEGGERGGREPEEPRRDLGVEEPSGHGSAGELEHLQVLGGGVEDGQRLRLHDGA
jgi:hypothetical protein